MKSAFTRQLIVSRPLFLALLLLGLPPVVRAADQGLKREVKVFVGAQFEIGENSGDRAGEFQHWYERYWADVSPITVRGAENAVFCGELGVCGSVLGMGKVRSSSSMTAILLDPRFDFSRTYFIISGVGGTPPRVGTIAAVFWADWLVDYDLGHRWAPEEGEPGAAVFKPRTGYENVRLLELNSNLVQWAYRLTRNVPLKDSDSARAYRMRYPDEAARRAPFVGVGTHIASDTFFHGPGLSEEAQYISDLYGASTYVITEMEGAAVAYVIKKLHSLDRVMSLRAAVNFDQGNPNETTLQHLDPEPGNTPGGFGEGVENNYSVGAVMVDYIVANWEQWRESIPPFEKDNLQ